RQADRFEEDENEHDPTAVLMDQLRHDGSAGQDMIAVPSCTIVLWAFRPPCVPHQGRKVKSGGAQTRARPRNCGGVSAIVTRAKHLYDGIAMKGAGHAS